MSTVKELLYDLGMGNLYEVNYIPENEESAYIEKIKDHLYSNFKCNCLKELTNFPILRTFVTFKEEFKLENYLLIISDYKIRKCIAKFRLGSHDLMIERGRHTKPKTPLENRTCQCCNLNVVEDEKHFLLVCPLFYQQRTTLFQRILTQEKSILETHDNLNRTFENILSSKNEKIIFSLGKFILKCFKMRKQYMR